MADKELKTKNHLSPALGSDWSILDIKLITSTDVREMVNMEKAVELMKDAFSSFAMGNCYIPQRYISSFNDISVDIFFKPVYCKELGRICMKMLTQKIANFERSRPTILGIVMLFDAETRETLAIIDGTYLTALRTGAASGIATKYLARTDAETVAVFGCGAQGRTQLEAVCAVRPVKMAMVFDIDPVASEQFKSELSQKLGIEIVIETDKNALKEADIICTATNSESPLFGKEDIKDGVHINAIGSYKPNMQEIDPEILKNSKIYVDSSKAVLSESGDFIKPISDRLITSDCIHAEIGDLIIGKKTGRQSPDEITVFKSVGLAVQDLYIANEVHHNSMM